MTCTKLIFCFAGLSITASFLGSLTITFKLSSPLAITANLLSPFKITGNLLSSLPITFKLSSPFTITVDLSSALSRFGINQDLDKSMRRASRAIVIDKASEGIGLMARPCVCTTAANCWSSYLHSGYLSISCR